MADAPALAPEVYDHLKRIATPANVAMTCTSGPSQWRPAKHLLYLNRLVFRALINRDSQTFLNVQASVRHGKSELLTKWTVFWFVGMFPGARILITSGDATLIKDWSRWMSETIKEHGSILFGMKVGTTDSAEEITTTNGGYIRFATSGTKIVGQGFDLIILDDPIASDSDARSNTVKENLASWYSQVIRTRLQPGGTMLFTMARWAEDDLSGRVVAKALEAREAGLPADDWIVVKLPAVATKPRGADDDWRDEIGRADGEPLWPEMWPLDVLLAIKYSLTDPGAWDALYQQDPHPPQGNMMDRDNWVLIEERPAVLLAQVRAWDTASTDKRGSDYTVGALMGKMDNGMTVILDIQRFKATVDVVEETILETSRLDGPQVMIRMEEEKAGVGKLTDHHYSKLFPDRDFDTTVLSGGKEERARIMASAQRRGMIGVIAGAPWLEEFFSECERFPGRGAHDDQVDATSLGYNVLWDVEGSAIAFPTSVLRGRVSVPTSPDVDPGIPTSSEWDLAARWLRSSRPPDSSGSEAA